ncbi:replication initiator [Rothia amarae]|uniref:replication initiator n=1 Tax=Rothia amarae TaxID=169480 RepID=UPI0033F61D48
MTTLTPDKEARERYCKHPRRIVKNGEVFYGRCGSQDYDLCPSCAVINARTVREIIDSGMNKKGFDYYLLTLTAPAFGAIGENGLPTGSYGYTRAVEWNNNSPRLFSRFMDSLTRKLGTDKLEYVRVAEYQRRGSVHYHTIIRVPDTVSTKDLAKYVRTARTATYKGYKWGRGYDLTPVAESTKDLASIAGYATKDLGRSQMLSVEQREHYSKMDAHAKRLDLSDKAIRGLGYAGQTFTQSTGWSTLTKALLKEQKRANADLISQESIDARVRRYEENKAHWNTILSARGHKGDYTPVHNAHTMLTEYDSAYKNVCSYRNPKTKDERRKCLPSVDYLTEAQMLDLMNEIRQNPSPLEHVF